MADAGHRSIKMNRDYGDKEAAKILGGMLAVIVLFVVVAACMVMAIHDPEPPASKQFESRKTAR